VINTSSQFDAENRKIALRREAEAAITNVPASSLVPFEGDRIRLLHELQLHQIELKLQNEKLMESQQERQALLDRYTDLFDFAPVGYVNLNSDGEIILLNFTIAKMIGFERDALAGRRFGLFIADRDRRAFNDFLVSVFSTDVKQVCELQLANMNEGHRYVRLEAILFIGGKECHVAIIDITERKQTEEARRQSQKMEAIGQMAGGIAHDYNNILTVIEGYASLLLGQTSISDPAYESLVEIRSASAHAVYLSRQLLAFSRRQVLRPETLDLNAMIVESNAMLQRLIGQNVHIELCLDESLHRIWAERGQVAQILMNLVINARDAMEMGGTISIRTLNTELEDLAFSCDGTNQTAGYALLSVSDTGSGMSDEVKAHAFEPFFTTKPTGSGTGIGLATVRSVVTRSSGHIEVESELGKGTTFKVYLPQLRNHQESKASEVLTANGSFVSQRGGGHTILLVEDDEAVRQLADSILSNAGFTVLSAANAENAIRVAEDLSQKIDLLLSDVVMPGMSGPELAERVRNTGVVLKPREGTLNSTSACGTRQPSREAGEALSVSNANRPWRSACGAACGRTTSAAATAATSSSSC